MPRPQIGSPRTYSGNIEIPGITRHSGRSTFGRRAASEEKCRTIFGRSEAIRRFSERRCGPNRWESDGGRVNGERRLSEAHCAGFNPDSSTSVQRRDSVLRKGSKILYTIWPAEGELFGFADSVCQHRHLRPFGQYGA